jgi:uncharacterized protein YegP (UPF0339 family)
MGALSEPLALLGSRATYLVPRRAERRSAMATAIKKSRAAGRPPRRAREVRVLESMEFLIFEDNGGHYHWTIVAADGATLARSAGFASYEDAERAAQHVRDGAGSARLERRHIGELPVDLSARRSATSDAADAERWLDEGGSFSSEAVAQWRTPR